MLVDVNVSKNNDGIDFILAVLSGGRPEATRIGTGLYKVSHFNFGDMLPRGEWEDYANLSRFGEDACAYGVCDSPEQFMAALGDRIAADPSQFVVSFTRVARSEQSPEVGWRWRKWGPYIGTQSPQCEYIHDEPEIAEVYCYHVFERKR